MYETGTILRLREPKSTDDTPFAYDKIEVIGTSPLSHSSLTSSWAGAEAQGVLIKPLTEFGSTLDEPFGRLRELYEVELIPEKVIPVHQDIKVIDTSSSGSAGASPEEIFQDARGSATETITENR